MFCGLFSAVPRVPSIIFMFCAPGVVSRGTESVKYRFHILRSRTHFRREPRASGPVFMFSRPDSFSAGPRALCPIFMFCASGLVFGSTEGVGSHFHVLRARTQFRRYRGRRLPFLCFALLDSFSSVPRASGPVFMFCARSTHFRRCRVLRLPFSCFARPNSFSSVSTASGPVFIFCAPGLYFGGTEGVWSRFHVLRSRTCFRRCRLRRVPFS
jgi:hypothetical protein